MADEYEVFIEASVRGYHAYFKDATVVIGEVLMCERELDNAYDKPGVPDGAARQNTCSSGRV